MSVWNDILQAVHSSVIDELNAQFPEDKLELGLPKRFDGWALAPDSETVLLREVLAGGGAGFAALGSRKDQAEALVSKIWDGAIVRATQEFKIRRIDAKFGKILGEAPKPALTIWLPIRIPTQKTSPVFDFAVGV